MNPLTPNRFEEFFCALNGATTKPFPWQGRLAQRVATTAYPDRAWPEALALPTASGKTACLDVAIFALACQAEWPAEKRTAARRIFFVVDRRVIVDEAFDRAQQLCTKLQEATDGILREVADALRLVSGAAADAEPLACFQLRGGVYRDDAWARTPTQPTIIASTVDQIGSRLLYRSYGASSHVSPIHAGLAGNDSLIILDEAHCSQPFLETLQAVGRYRKWAEQPLPLPFAVVVMSATPPSGLEDVLTANDEDRNHPILGGRLNAPKPCKLIVATKATGTRAFHALAEELVGQALALAGDGSPKATALIVNRVVVARYAHDLLLRAGRGEVALLTGRMRPIDRDAVLDEWMIRLHASRSTGRTLNGHVFIVATQCLEVGANLDFDIMVSECASLDALRQRFGRLNRMGRQIESRGVVVIRGDQIEPMTDPADQDPIYGNALPHTWAWLNAQADNGELDLGIAAVQAALDATVGPDSDLFSQLNAPAPHAPILLPAHLDCWVQTAPEPCPSPDVGVFLHGPQPGAADVMVCWRGDLPAGELDSKVWIDVVSLCPPVTAECMPVPWHILRRWFAGEASADTGLSDVEGAGLAGNEGEPPAGPRRMALRWRGPEQSQLITQAAELRPGDTLILPAVSLGWDTFGHVPSPPANPAGIDRGDEAHLRVRSIPVLRLHPDLIACWPDSVPRRDLQALAADPNLSDRLGEPDFIQELKTALGELEAETTTPDWMKDAAQALSGDSRLARQVQIHPCGGLVLRGSRRLRRYMGRSGAFADDDNIASAAAPVPLADHCQRVRELAARFVQACGLRQVAETMTLAAQLHDAGKADSRFQAMLRGGDNRAAFAGTELLAKSDVLPSGWRAYLEARQRAGYPAGGRHELVSMKLAESAASELETDRDLVLHLIASHHGRCRPMAPVIVDDTPVEVSFPFAGVNLRTSSHTGSEQIDSGVAERFWKLVRRHGWWGIAYLEAVLRLADHRVSEAEQRNTDVRTNNHESKATR